MSYEADIGSGPAWPGYERWAEDVRTCLRRMRQLGLASADEIDVETLAARLREETVGHNGMARTPILVSARAQIAD